MVVGGAGGTGEDEVCEPDGDVPAEGDGVPLVPPESVPTVGNVLPERDVPASAASEGVVLLPSPPPQEASKEAVTSAVDSVRRQLGKKEAVCKSISFWQFRRQIQVRKELLSEYCQA